MDRTVIAALAACVGLLAGSASAHPASSPSAANHHTTAQGPAAAVVVRFHAELAKGDAAAAALLLDPAATVFEEGYVERTKAEYVAGHLPSDIAFTRAVAETVERRDVVSGADMAVVTSESRIAGTFKDKAVDRISVETMVLRRGPAGWRIVHIHWSGRAAPKPAS